VVGNALEEEAAGTGDPFVEARRLKKLPIAKIIDLEEYWTSLIMFEGVSMERKVCLSFALVMFLIQSLSSLIIHIHLYSFLIHTKSDCGPNFLWAFLSSRTSMSY
jgi:hypothetical protein